MQGKVEICGVNTSRLGVLSQVEMDSLLRRARCGDISAREKLIEGNLRLVLSVIQRFDKRGENPDDLFQVGCIGLIKAISNFDPDKNVRFSTYGVPMIILCRNTKIGVSTMTRKQALHKAVEVLAQTQGNEEAIRILEELSSELPIIHWSDSSIRDCVEQFMVDYGRFPKATDFKRAGMPPHPVIMNHYGMCVTEWLDQNYPGHKPTREELKEKYTKAFIEDYNRIKPRSGEEFNAKKTNKTRGWRAVARYYNLGTWRNFIKHLGLTPYFDMKRDHVPVKFDVDVELDKEFLYVDGKQFTQDMLVRVYGCGNNSSTENMGASDEMPYHTGTMMASKTEYSVGVQYRHIEGLRDNLLDRCDGIYRKDN